MNVLNINRNLTGAHILYIRIVILLDLNTRSLLLNEVELQWLEHLWNHENMFKTEVVRANEC